MTKVKYIGKSKKLRFFYMGYTITLFDGVFGIHAKALADRLVDLNLCIPYYGSDPVVGSEDLNSLGYPIPESEAFDRIPNNKILVSV